jgi:hypothetical protein
MKTIPNTLEMVLYVTLVLVMMKGFATPQTGSNLKTAQSLEYFSNSPSVSLPEEKVPFVKAIYVASQESLDRAGATMAEYSCPVMLEREKVTPEKVLLR